MSLELKTPSLKFVYIRFSKFSNIFLLLLLTLKPYLFCKLLVSFYFASPSEKGKTKIGKGFIDTHVYIHYSSLPKLLTVGSLYIYNIQMCTIYRCVVFASQSIFRLFGLPVKVKAARYYIVDPSRRMFLFGNFWNYYAEISREQSWAAEVLHFFNYWLWAGTCLFIGSFWPGTWSILWFWPWNGP